RQADRHADAGEALLQEAEAADDGGREPLDAPRGPVPRARLVRSADEARDDSRVRESARGVDLARWRRDRVRHVDRGVADGGRAPRRGPRARSRGPRGVSVRGPKLLRAAFVLALLLAPLARADTPAPTQRDIEESLTCQCGCGLTVHA